MRTPRLIFALVIGFAGCDKKEPAPAIRTTGSAAPTVEVAPVDAAGLDAPIASAGTDCLPKSEPDSAVDYHLARAGGQLSVCATSFDKGLVACRNIDATGKLSARALEPQVGVGLSVEGNSYQGLSWPKNLGDPAEVGTNAYVAFHADKKRVAVLHGDAISIFDVASKKQIKSFPLRKDGNGTVRDNEISNTPAGVWFVGESVFVLGVDAGPAAAIFPYSLDGKPSRSYWGMYHGDATVSDDRLIIAEDAATKVTVLDGKSPKGKTLVRALPKGGCKIDQWADEEELPSDKCGEFIKKHYLPFDGASVVEDDAGGFIALVEDDFVRLDHKLVETARVKLPLCP